MKILKLISIVACLSILCGLGCTHSEMTKAQVSEMFDKAGGVYKINQEAKIIFTHYGTNISTVIYGQQLTNFPAISSLSSSVFLQTNSGWSTCIEIPIGSHYQKSFIFIFNPDDVIEFPYASNCIVVTTNIFVWK